MAAEQRPLAFLDPARFEEVREIRAHDPEQVRRILADRIRRPTLAERGRLFIVAADHPARGALGVGDEPMKMGDRYRLLDRLALALSRPGVDGVLGTPDIIEDLALLGLLDDKVIVGSMNRGGLKGSSFELDDRFTGYDIPGIVRDGFDFAKTLLRIDLTDPASVATLAANAEAVTQAAAAGVRIMVEPFMSRRDNGRVVNDLTTDAVITSIAITAGLGSTSAYTWAKLPVVRDMERVMESTTLPTLLLGGDQSDDQDKTYESWDKALGLPGVRGLVVGRTLLYPPDDDVQAAIDIAASLVHETVPER